MGNRNFRAALERISTHFTRRLDLNRLSRARAQIVRRAPTHHRRFLLIIIVARAHELALECTRRVLRYRDTLCGVLCVFVRVRVLKSEAEAAVRLCVGSGAGSLKAQFCFRPLRVLALCGGSAPEEIISNQHGYSYYFNLRKLSGAFNLSLACYRPEGSSVS